MLVHGSWHGAWCWERVAPLLSQEGHTVLAPDLPGHGADQTPPAGLTLESYAGRVAGCLEGLGEPAVLVGHSFGGVVISQAAELVPGKIAHLVYLCAFLLRDGQSAWRHGLGAASESLLKPENLNVEGGEVTLTGRVVFDGFYGGCSPEDARWASRLIRPEPLGPMQTALRLGPGGQQRIPRTYIECAHDRIVPPEDQRRMCRLTPVDRTSRLETGHSPFFEDPEALAEQLLALPAGSLKP